MTCCCHDYQISTEDHKLFCDATSCGQNRIDKEIDYAKFSTKCAFYKQISMTLHCHLHQFSTEKTDE